MLFANAMISPAVKVFWKKICNKKIQERVKDPFLD
jgi:hypothetical protein